VQLSKALSLLLRHQAASAGIKLDGEGYAPLDKVVSSRSCPGHDYVFVSLSNVALQLQWPRIRSLNPTVADVRKEVTNSDKQRFAMKLKNPAAEGDDDDNAGEESQDPADWLIRANQGHSIALASEGIHTPITLESNNLPSVVVHGTYFAFWPAILASGGLKKMGRTHVHFGTGLPEDGTPASGSDKGAQAQVHEAEAEETEGGQKPKVISGMRSDAELLIFIDLAQSLKDDGECKWWISANGVVLTEGDKEGGVVPLKYFKEVRGRRQGVGLLWKDGEKVADLPEGLVAKVPHGKGRSGGGGNSRGGRGGRGGRS
jgi:2'-phosphotransferase